MPAGSHAIHGFKAYTAASRHERTTWIVVDEASERRDRDIIGAIEARTDRFDIPENSRGYDWNFWRHVHGEDAAARYLAPYEAQYARTLR